MGLFKVPKLIALYFSDLSFLLSEDMTSGQDPSNPPQDVSSPHCFPVPGPPLVMDHALCYCLLCNLQAERLESLGSDEEKCWCL